MMRIIQETAIDESQRLGAEKGNFPNFEKSVWPAKVKTMRNASLTNVAPTGSTSMLADVSSGVEPYFALAYRRGNCLAGKMAPFVNKHLQRALEAAGCLNDAVMDQILTTGTLQDVHGVPDTIKRVFVTSLDISAEEHILMQGIVQERCCNAISKTVNSPNSAAREMVRIGFIEGWRRKCKGSRSIGMALVNARSWRRTLKTRTSPSRLASRLAGTDPAIDKHRNILKTHCKA